MFLDSQPRPRLEKVEEYAVGVSYVLRSSLDLLRVKGLLVRFDIFDRLEAQFLA